MSKKFSLAKFELKNVQGLTTKQLNAGAYGAVYEVTVDGVPRIAKRIHAILKLPGDRPEGGEAITRRFVEECILLSKLNHPKIVEFIGIHYADSARTDLCLIMERLCMNLEQYLNPKKRPNIALSIKLSILCDVSAGLVYLHNQTPPIIHRDLTAANVLLTKDLQAKIADLGVSKLIDVHPNEFARLTACPGALAYMPPEALKDPPVYDTQLDVFSYGEIVLYVAVQEFPQVFDVSGDPDMSAALKENKVHILKRKKWISKLHKLKEHCLLTVINDCLKDIPERRPSAKKLNSLMKKLSVKHPKSLSDVILSWCDQTEKQEIEHLENQLRDQVKTLTEQLTKIEQYKGQIETLQVQKRQVEEDNAKAISEKLDIQSRLEIVKEENTELRKQLNLAQNGRNGRADSTSKSDDSLRILQSMTANQTGNSDDIVSCYTSASENKRKESSSPEPRNTPSPAFDVKPEVSELCSSDTSSTPTEPKASVSLDFNDVFLPSTRLSPAQKRSSYVATADENQPVIRGRRRQCHSMYEPPGYIPVSLVPAQEMVNHVEEDNVPVVDRFVCQTCGMVFGLEQKVKFWKHIEESGHTR